MQIESRMVEIRNIPSAVKSKAVHNAPISEARRSRRDRADFDRRNIAFAEAVNPDEKLSQGIKAEPAVTAEEIQAEIDRLKDNPAQIPEIADKPADSKAAEALREQIKSVSGLLADKSNGLSLPVTKQLEKIYALLCKQEKTDPNSVSEELQDEIDKLSDMLSADKTEKKKSLAELLEEQNKRVENLFSHIAQKDNTLCVIKNKIRQGQKLTAYEQQTLSAKDPAAYESYRKVNTARKMFRCSLNSCRTRDDVIGMRLSNALSALSSYKKAIREGGDGNDIVSLNAAFENELRDFTKSSGFRALPTVAECNKFDRDMSKARKYEREKRLEKRRKQLHSKKYKKKAKKTPGDGKRTVAQVLADPTSKKVLASRAKRTYCSCAKGVSLYLKMNSRA